MINALEQFRSTMSNRAMSNRAMSNRDMLNPTRVDLTRFDVRNLPTFVLPTFELPGDLAKMELPSLPVERVAAFARDAAYVGVGAAVVAAKAADDRRRELTDQITAQVRKLVDAVA